MLIRLFARLTSPWAWRSPRQKARRFCAFAQAEESSKLDLLLAANLTPNFDMKAAFIGHALDETRHARMFMQRAQELARNETSGYSGNVMADFEHLYTVLGEVRFLAFVHHGERRGRNQFEVYREYLQRSGDKKSATMLDAILVDESRHENYTGEALTRLSGDGRARERLIRRMVVWEFWRRWRRVGRGLQTVVFTLMMLVIYVAVLPLALTVRWFLPVHVGWRRASGP